MNHYAARQRQANDRWDYTVANPRSGTRPIGYCRGYRELAETEHPHMSAGDIAEYNEELRAHKDQYHSDGHATAEEAEACYRSYLLDYRLRFHEDSVDAQTQHKCQECGAWTSGMAEIDMRHWYLCKEHRTRLTVEKLFPSIGEAWSS